MWSIFDTLILISGMITVVIAILPVPEIRAKTRAAAALVGGGLILLAIILGQVAFRYPSIVYVGPLIALAALGVVVAEARGRRRKADMQFDDRAHGVAPLPTLLPEPAAAPAPAQPAAEVPAAAEMQPETPVATLVQPQAAPARHEDEPRQPTPSERDAAWRAANDPTTSPARLAEVVETYPEFGDAIATHRNCYPELRQWIADYVSRNG